MIKIKSFFGDESGATAIEYGLILALVTVAVLGAWEILGISVNQAFTNISDSLVYAMGL